MIIEVLWEWFSLKRIVARERKSTSIIIFSSFPPLANMDDSDGGFYVLVDEIGVQSSICRIMAYLQVGKLWISHMKVEIQVSVGDGLIWYFENEVFQNRKNYGHLSNIPIEMGNLQGKCVDIWRWPMFLTLTSKLWE